MTINDILTEIIAETVSDLTAANMLAYFKSAMRTIPSFVQNRMFLSEKTLTLTAGLSSLDLGTLDPAFSTERHIWYVDSEGSRIPITKPSSLDSYHTYKTTTIGKPVYYRIYGDTIDFDKPADSNLTIGFDYFYQMSSGITVDTVFAADEELIECVKNLTKSFYYLQYEEDSEKANTFGNLAKSTLDKMSEKFEIEESSNSVEETEEY